jgi:hypothetical protein
MMLAMGLTRRDPLEAFIAALAPGDTTRHTVLDLDAPGDVGRLARAFARSERLGLRLGGWEVGMFGEDDARRLVRACGVTGALGGHTRFHGIGNDTGELTAVVGWSTTGPEAVYVLDPEYRTARPQGTLAAWLVHLALTEADPDLRGGGVSELAKRINPLSLAPVTDWPPDPKLWQPEVEIAAALKGSGHMGFADVGAPVAVHRKGIRAWIDGKKKAKGVVKSNATCFDAAGNAVWIGIYRGAARITFPELEPIVREGFLTRSDAILVALADGSAVVSEDHGCLSTLVVRGNAIAVGDTYPTGLDDQFVAGTRSRWIACGDWRVGRVLLYRWDGEALQVQGGWRGSLGWLREAEGALYTNHGPDAAARVVDS